MHDSHILCPEPTAVASGLGLRTYRMLYVTQRPLPRVACGLGVWASIFSAINVFRLHLQETSVAVKQWDSAET